MTITPSALVPIATLLLVVTGTSPPSMPDASRVPVRGGSHGAAKAAAPGALVSGRGASLGAGAGGGQRHGPDARLGVGRDVDLGAGPGIDPGGSPTQPSHGPTAGTTSLAALPRGRWDWPLAPRPGVVRRFAAPTSRYGPGHRGVDLAAHPGQPVLAVDSGTVSHVGVIAGRGTVTLLHASGLRSTYEPVTATVRRGDVVARGGPLGTISDVTGHCHPGTCLHLGAVRGHTYVDPLRLLGIRRVRLLPLE